MAHSLYKGRSAILPLLYKTSDAQLSMDILMEIQKDNIPGHSLVHKFGHNHSVPSGVWAHVSVTPFVTANFLEAADNVRIKAGGNAADDSAGLGAQEITVKGIVATTLFEETDIIATNGITVSAATTKQFWRIHTAYISPLSVGTYSGANTGAIVVESDSGSPVDLITIDAGEGRTQYAGYTIPAGKTGYLLSAHITVNTGKSVSFRMFTRANITNVSTPFYPKLIQLQFDGLEAPFSFRPRSPGEGIPAGTDVWWECNGSAGTEQVSVDFELILVND